MKKPGVGEEKNYHKPEELAWVKVFSSGGLNGLLKSSGGIKIAFGYTIPVCVSLLVMLPIWITEVH